MRRRDAKPGTKQIKAAETGKKAGKRRTTAAADGLRVRKSGVSKSHKPGLRKPKLKKTDPRKQKPSLQSETARLKRQLKAARMREEASAEILRAVANASGDAAGPLQLIAETTARLFKASSVSIQLAEGSEFTQEYRVGAIAKRVGSAYPRSNIRVGGRNLPGTVVAESRQIHIPDLDRLDPSMSDFPGLPHARAGGARTVCGTPLRRDDRAIGALIVFRDRLLPFTGDELALLQSFADQAVIAIQNVRLFNETKEALAGQTATADILRVISQSPTDVQPVFDAIVLTAVRLFKRNRSFILRCDGATFWPVALAGPDGLLPFPDLAPEPIDRDANFPSRAIVNRKNLHLPDWSKIDLPEYERQIRDTFGFNSSLYLPLLREGECIGVLGIAGTRAGRFDDDEIALAESFRDQALIAIENTRLFNETREALERQTATADILKVIASSPSNVQPVFNALVLTARRLLGREMASIILCGDDATFRAVAGAGPDGLIPIDPIFAAPTKIDPEANFPSRAIVSKKNLHLPDWSAIDLPEEERNIQEMVGWNSTLYLPMLRGEECIGVLLLGGTQPGIFSEADMALAESFRDQAAIAIENARLFNETQEALERQTATSDILNVIASSPTDTQPVFDAIARSAAELCEATNSGVFRLRDGLVHFAGHHNLSPEQLAFAPKAFPAAPHRGYMAGRAIVDRAVAHVPDIAADPEYSAESMVKAGFRSALSVPMLRNGEPIGAINVTREEARPFSVRQIELLKTFADQAVIAIENTRLFNETQEALERQTATADILRIISRSVAHAAPVFDTILESCQRLFNPYDAAVYLVEGDRVRGVARRGPGVGDWGTDSMPLAGSSTGVAIAERRPLHFPDLADKADLPEDKRDAVRLAGGMSVLYAPIISESRGVGSLVVTRQPKKPFAETEIEFIQSFADQAAIAIENGRLFNETKEALERQTATADILKVMAGSPSDVQPVFDAIVKSANRLLSGNGALATRVIDDTVHLAAMTSGTETATKAIRGLFPAPLSSANSHGRVAATGHALINNDIPNNPEQGLAGIAAGNAWGFRSLIIVPMLREGTAIGTIGVSRAEAGEFSDHQIRMLQTFADQAVIAIENTRLFNETKEALERQTATSEILRVISQSPTDVQPVFDAIVRAAVRLIRCEVAFVLRCDGATFSPAAAAGPNGPLPDLGPSQLPIDPALNFPSRAIVGKKNVYLPDWSLIDLPEHERQMRALIGVNSSLFLPLLREGECIGVLALADKKTNIFGESEIALAESFRDQALIAIENTRLFNETQEALERQTATADILKVIASSPDDVQPVFQAIAERSNNLVGGFATTVVSIIDDVVHLSAFTSTNPAADAALRAFYPRPLSGFSYGDAVRRGETHRIVDIELEPGLEPDQLTMVRQRGWRSALWVPLLLEGMTIGAIGVTRVAPGAFADYHVDMLKTFADQAVIAISNVKLFREVQERTRELSQSLDELRTAQDRLVQTEKLASLGQLTAGIAHEIKNPLNFVNNFSALSVELIDEMNDVFDNPALDDTGRRKELDEIRELLKSNLEKVVQHGKRADSIVKNMLLHSRDGSGEQRAVDINALLDESLNLAYHGARAEKPEFNITLQRDLDPDAGVIELFPQEITRALLNLISNGFYAASKRGAENGEADFEPVLSAATRNLGHAVEIRIRDNGTGIPPEVKEKMFNPFFTTKPAGEGTGLGLSMSHDIVVKQHGGRIEVDTQPGQFTEFTIVLPRAANLAGTGKN